jgi:hypothetical protein
MTPAEATSRRKTSRYPAAAAPEVVRGGGRERLRRAGMMPRDGVLMTTNKKRPRDFLSLVNVREELQLSGMRIDPSGAMGRRWSGVERVWAFLRVRPRQRAHHYGAR